MAKAIKLQDLKKVLTLATSSTKKLVEAGVQGKEDFPKLLAKYKWSGTRDFNLALIIIALYAYCLKQGGELKSVAQKAIAKDKSDEKGLKSTLGALRYGNGPKLAEYLSKDFGDKTIQTIILQDSIQDSIVYDMHEDEDEDGNIALNIVLDIDKVFKNGLFKQAKKIKPWKHNARDVDYCVRLLKGDIKKEKENEKEEKEKEIKELNEKIESIQKQYGDELKDYEALKTNYIKLLTENNDLQKELEDAYQTGDRVFHNSNVTSKKLQKLEDAYNELLANLKKLKESQKGSRHTDITEFADITKLENSPVNNLVKEFFPESESNVINVDELIDGFNEMAEGQPKNSPEKKAANKINRLKIDPKFVDNLANIVANGDPKLKKQITEKTITIDTITNNRTRKKHYRILGKQPAGLFNYLTDNSKNNPIKDENDRPQDKKSILYPFDSDIHKKVLDFLKGKGYNVIVNEW